MKAMERKKTGWGWFLALGLFLVIAGVGVASAPMISTIAVELLIGWGFLIAGVLLFVQVFRSGKDWSAGVAYLALSGLNTLAGLFVLFRPLEGLVALTLVAITAVFVIGLFRILIGIQAWSNEGSGIFLFSGCFSVAVSSWLLWIYPEISIVLLGIVVGLAMIGEGASYIREAYFLKVEFSE